MLSRTELPHVYSRVTQALGTRPPPSDFTAFYRASYSGLVGQAFLLVGNIEEAQELAQEVMLRVWREWDKSPALDDPLRWARVVLIRLAGGLWLRRKVRLRFQAQIAETGSLPELSADHLEVAKAMQSLPTKHKQVLVMRAILGMSFEEISHEMNVPCSTVRTWLSRARGTMAERLQVYE